MIKAYIVVFIASFCTLVIELIAGKIVAPNIGVSLYTWTSVIGVVLAGISIGNYIGGLFADRYPSSKTLGTLLLLSGISSLYIAPLANSIGAGPSGYPLLLKIVYVITAIFFIPSFLLGTITPVVIKLTLKDLGNTGSIVGKIYAVSTLGSIVGTFLTGFYLVSWMGTRKIALLISVVLVITGIIFGGFIKSIRFSLLIGVFFTVFLLAYYNNHFELPSGALTDYQTETNYFTIVVGNSIGDNEQSLKTLVLDNLIHSYVDLKDPLYIHYEYEKVFQEVVNYIARNKKDLNTLFLGGGGYTFPRYMEIVYPKSNIEVIEIDPEVTKIAHEHLGLSKTTTIKTYNYDARGVIMNWQRKGEFDIIFGDAFNDISIPYHLTTLEFDRMIYDLLKSDGYYIVNLIDDYRHGQFLRAFIRTLMKVFGEDKVYLLSISNDLDIEDTSTYVVLGAKGPFIPNEFVRTASKKSKNPLVSILIPFDVLKKDLSKPLDIILTDDYVPVDNFMAANHDKRYRRRSRS